ncbi:hypothetical protein DENSPDRAFT_836056 [Dentipellis sp. KUC8613]|nr:hypothetical protein DENSPDRAFT_836056 [Dentipellis sp. KUC8613]
MIYHSGYGAGIMCDGAIVPHYRLSEQGHDTLSCYVTSETGKEFSIQFTDQRRETETRVDCWIDGNYWTGKSARAGRNLLIWGARDSPNTRAAFRFSELTLVDEDEGPGYSGNIGVIEIRVHRVQNAPCHPSRITRRYEHREPPQIGPISERSKKGGWHQVSLGSSQVSLWRPPATRTIYLDGRDHPFVIFRFFYRPRALLQAEGIIPRPLAIEDGRRQHASTLLVRQPNHARHHRYNNQPGGSSGAGASRPALGVIDLDSDENTAPVKLERRSPIRVGEWAGQVIDLTLDSDTD